MPLRVAVLVFALSASAANADVSQADVTPLEKVVVMLEDLQTQVITEGKAEAKTYDKFACFCKDMMQEKADAITSGQDQQDELSSSIEELKTERDKLDTKLAELQQGITKLEKNMKEASKKRAQTEAMYDANRAGMKGALEALEAAIGALKASRPSSLTALRSMVKPVRKATLIADALGIGGPKVQKVMTALLQQPQVPMQDYSFQSEEILGMLEDLLKDFQASKHELNEEEVKSITEHEKVMQAKTTEKDAKEGELEKMQKRKAKISQEMQGKSGDLSTVSSTLLDDQQYLKGLAETCSTKAQEWDARTKCRREELAALTQAISIMKGIASSSTSEQTIQLVQHQASLGGALEVAASDDAMEAIEAGTEQEDSNVAFLQLRRSPWKGLGRAWKADSRALGKAAKALDKKFGKKLQGRIQLQPGMSNEEGETLSTEERDKRAEIVSLLRSQGQALKSTLLSSLAAQVAADPFKKIKKLIQELIENLLQKAADEADHKGWCDKEMSKAKQTRDNTAEGIESLNGELATAEALRNKLLEEIGVLSEETNQLTYELTEATAIRDEEKAENESAIKEAKEGQDAVKQAIQVLSEFYKKTGGEGAVLVQTNPEAPPAGFEGPYKGKQDEGAGILGMLDVISGDFVRTIEETTTAETKAAQEFLEFERKSKVSIATKTEAKEDGERRLNDTEEKLSSDKDSLESDQQRLNHALEEQQELHKACLDTGMTTAERAAQREEEIDSLKKALCIVDTMGPLQTENC